MKTAMQELIDKLIKERLSNPDDSPLSIGLTVAVGLATELLEKEKQQIIRAVNDAEWYSSYPDVVAYSGEDYFNATFKNNK